MLKKEKGFTLIELLVVVAIIGTLSGLVLVAMGGARKKARDSVRKSDMRQVLSGQEMYYGDNEAYLTHAEDTTGTIEIPAYLRVLHDPLCPNDTCSSGWTGKDYTWEANTSALDCTDGDYDAVSGQWFCVWAELEVNDSSCSSTTFMAASHKGTLIVCDTAPTITTGCTCMVSS